MNKNKKAKSMRQVMVAKRNPLDKEEGNMNEVGVEEADHGAP